MYGLDWLATAFGWTACYLISKKRQLAFAWGLWTFVTLIWITIGIHQGIWGMVASQAGYFFIDGWAFIKELKKGRKS